MILAQSTFRAASSQPENHEIGVFHAAARGLPCGHPGFLPLERTGEGVSKKGLEGSCPEGGLGQDHTVHIVHTHTKAVRRRCMAACRESMERAYIAVILGRVYAVMAA